MTTFALFSHVLRPDGPNWPDAPGLTIEPCHQMDAGDIATTHVVSVYTHYGTHLDMPAHFIPGAATLGELRAEDLVFHRPHCLNLPLAAGELLTADHLVPHEKELAGVDLLLIRSGFEQHRSLDREHYERAGPGLDHSAATYLRQLAPTLRAIAIDWLSVCAYGHIDAGVEAHRILLGGDTPVLIFEDVRLSVLDDADVRRVVAAPILIEGLDGFPVTMLAEVESK